jgi:hypothetical protein
MKTKWIIGILIFLVGVLGTSTLFLGWRLAHFRDSFRPPMQERPMMRDDGRPMADRLSPQARRQLHEAMMKFRSRTEPIHEQIRNQQQVLYQVWKSNDEQRVDSILQIVAKQRLAIAREAFGMLDSASVFLSPEQQQMVLQRILNINTGPSPRIPRNAAGSKFRNR